MSPSSLPARVIRRFCLLTWGLWERLGIHVSPNHFYWPIPDSRALSGYDFDERFTRDGIRLDRDRMLATLAELARFRNEYEPLHVDSAYASNGDGAILYGMIRKLQPRTVVEVGAGESSRIILSALRANASADPDPASLVSIEPYPKDSLRALVEASPDHSLLEKRVETIAPDYFESTLHAGDVLFIDSSHVVATGNDVHTLFLRVLPRLPVGVIVHIHDIRYPLDYPRAWVLGARKIWSEQYLLQSFLAFNDSFEIEFAGNFMYLEYRRQMADALVGLSEHDEGWPGCFWIRRVR